MSNESRDKLEALQATEFASAALPNDNRGTAHPDNKEMLHGTLYKKPVAHLSGAPDGGLTAWLVVVAVHLVLFSTFGITNSWGVFQAYYEENILRYSSPSNIAWIGSVQYALVYLPALVAGRIFDLGYFKIPCLAASSGIVVSAFLTAECTQFWHFFLVQGFSMGVCCGIIVGPAMVVISHWFDRKRGLAMSFTAIGGSIGSTVFPITAQKLIPLIGFKWTMRVFGFMLLATLGMANILLKRRLPPINVHGGLFNLKSFRNKAYSIFCVAGILGFLGLYTVLTYVSLSAVAIGGSENLAFYIIAIANGASIFGRLLSGLMADKIGALNTMIAFTAMAGITTFAWPFVTNESQLIAIVIIYGFSSGGFVALFAVAIVAMGDMEDAGRRVGMFMSLVAFGATAGPPISGAISAASRGFVAAGLYAGSTMMCSVVSLLLARYFHLGRVWGKC